MPALRRAALPIAILGAAWLLEARIVPWQAADVVPAWVPYAVCAVGSALALAFNRGRVVFALALIAAAHAICGTFLGRGPGTPVAQTVFAALAMGLPLDLALLAALPERGLFNRHGAARLAIVAAQFAAAGWLAMHHAVPFAQWAYAVRIDLLWVNPVLVTPLPQVALAAIGASVLAAIAATAVRCTPIEWGLAAAVAACTLALHGVGTPRTVALWLSAAALVLTMAVVQDGLRMAFRDDLTGLPSRRALNEALAGVGARYAVAMLDVDHFKRFNDTHGHDVGDQVLRMVAAHIQRVGGGGRAFRYGGEEFTVLFPGRSAQEALPHLETLRAAIARYRMKLRASNRPQRANTGRKRRTATGTSAGKSVSVTISIGAAERGARSATPQDVIRAADKALYRAKHKGRNQVSL